MAHPFAGSAKNRFVEFVPGGLPSHHRRALEGGAFFYSGLMCLQEDESLFDRLCQELEFRPAWLDNGMPFSRQISLCSDSLLTSCPTLREVLDKLMQFFSLEPMRALVNFYRDGDDWCNLHSDQYDAGHCDINFTVGASFGQERTLVFEPKFRRDQGGVGSHHGKARKMQVAIVQRNGDVHAFDQNVNEQWRHGIQRCSQVQGSRLSVMLWGYRGDNASVTAHLTLPGGFPHLLHFDPRIRGRPRACEACGKTKMQAGGKVDADHRWSCGACLRAHDDLGGLPRAAQGPDDATDCLTLQGAQFAAAVLAGRKTVECRWLDLPDGWYALHVSRCPIEPREAQRVREHWPTAPLEHELPHDALVGVVHLLRHADRHFEISSPWLGAGHCYIITQVVAPRKILPTRAQGDPGEPWRMSPAAARSLRELIRGMPVYRNAPPRTSLAMDVAPPAETKTEPPTRSSASSLQPSAGDDQSSAASALVSHNTTGIVQTWGVASDSESSLRWRGRAWDGFGNGGRWAGSYRFSDGSAWSAWRSGGSSGSSANNRQESSWNYSWHARRGSLWTSALPCTGVPATVPASNSWDAEGTAARRHEAFNSAAFVRHAGTRAAAIPSAAPAPEPLHTLGAAVETLNSDAPALEAVTGQIQAPATTLGPSSMHAPMQESEGPVDGQISEDPWHLAGDPWSIALQKGQGLDSKRQSSRSPSGRRARGSSHGGMADAWRRYKK